MTAGPEEYHTPLPRMQLFVLMMVRLAEPVQYTVIFPFVNQMVEELKVTDEPDKIGYYSGLIEAVFALVQFFTVYHWAVLSDSWGRKPVILIGLSGVAISGALFGFATNFWQMILFRCLSGALSGNVAVVRACLGDITDDSNSTDAFALYGLVWVVGSIFGNTIGGFLSHPVERIPQLFGSLALLKSFPFLLPCLVTTFVTLCGLSFTFFFLKESHATVLHNRAKTASRPSTSVYIPLATSASSDKPFLSPLSHDSRQSLDSNEEDRDTLIGSGDNPNSPVAADLGQSDGMNGLHHRHEGSEETIRLPGEVCDYEEEYNFRVWTFWDIIALKAVQNMLGSLFLISFVGGAWGAVSLLFFYTPTSAGGLGMNPGAIGTALAAQGLWSIICQLWLLGKFRRKFGVAKSYKILNSGFVIVFASLPLLRCVVIAAEGTHAGENSDAPRAVVTWIAIMSWLFLSTVVGMSNSFSMVLINMAAPEKGALGALNGISTSVGCLARVLGPSLVSALFAVSIDQQIWGGQMWWIAMTMISMVSSVVGLLVKEKTPIYQKRALEGSEAGPETPTSAVGKGPVSPSSHL